ncbi:hypothetical protein ASD00_26820 [Ensifer sp. Root31]|uniref:HEPN domain-containing protein n=1 Tax=Ensifer sp. Root31 TaxID=1736512 RepID=UPI00070E2166|nr:HEPN domain-containing protein [Ensifer sp. Root31]KQU89471.1 hypothetical protein ASD00_26820 [Ensifer sp. Root31]
MAGDLLDILRDAQRDLRTSGYERYQYDPSFTSVYPARLYDNIEFHYPFSEWRNRWLAWGDDGLGAPARDTFGRWLMFELLSGKQPEKLVLSVEKLLLENCASFADVYICRGIEVASRVNLADGAYLLNLGLLTEIDDAPRVFAPPPGMNISKPCSALVLPFHMQVVSFMPSEQRPLPSSATALSRMLLAQTIRQSLILSGSVAIRLPGKFRISQTIGYPYRRDQIELNEGEAAVAVGPSPDLDLARTLITQLRTFPDLRPINIAVDRINRARSASNDADAAIDYGIALEVVLMHGDPAANQEISNKLGLRAGWLLGTDIKRRLDVKSKMSRVYCARSDAAHRGHLREETQRRFSRPEADLIAVQCVRAVLQKGRFPDWNKLLFGEFG